ncbi:hypothetical protein K9F10_12835 [Staphylococcus pseudintermedius]|nr:hypothetical protein K9F10_12835 [Staphylococcus pseudintermedius]
MILLTYEDSDYIHRVATEHVKLLQSDTLIRTQGTQIEIALYEEMIAHRLRYARRLARHRDRQRGTYEGLCMGTL